LGGASTKEFSTMPAMEGPPAGSISGSDATAAGGSAPSTSGASTSSARWKGRVLKRFKLVDLLGQGSMGRVFRAEDVTLRRYVALKVLPTKNKEGQRDQKIEQFIREARSAASVEHPNAVTVYEIGETSGVHYIAMELVEGGNLERIVRASGPMEIDRACQIGAEAAEALAAAHLQGIIHRDVKPSNLLLSRNGRCKLADFGLARFEDPEDLTPRGECAGTPCYIAPELPLGQKATEQSDIYSLGCTLWFLLTGKPPFEAASKRDMMKMHIHAALPDLRERRPDTPDRLVDAIYRACAKNPIDRFESADQFAKVLRTFTISTGSSSRLPTLAGGVNASGSMPAWAPSPGSGQPAASSTNLGPHLTHTGASFGPIPPMASAAPAPPGTLEYETRSKIPAPMLWAGIGTVATAALIVIGVLIARDSGGSGGGASSRSAKPAATVQIVNGTNVITDGTMDPPPGAADGIYGWFVHDRFKANVQFVSEDGNRFVRLTNDDMSKTVFVDQRIKVDPAWKAITVSVRMRASDFTHGPGSSQDARLAFAFRDASDKRVGSWPMVPLVKESTPWIERTVTADVPPNADSIYIQMAIFNATGTVDFDDVRVIPQIAKAGK
jgi:serine/threonine-protein kinase